MVFTSSPLLLDRADRVVLVHEGEAVAVGVHRELLRSEPRYRAVVTRETDEEAALGNALGEAVGDERVSLDGALTDGVLKDLEDDALEEIEETA